MYVRLLFILGFIINNLSAVGEAGAIFLLISPGAGPQGSGEAQVAKADDAYASYYNPAGFGFLSGREAAGMHVQWLPNLADDLYYEFLAYRHYINGLGSVGGHIIFLNLGEQIGMDEQGNPTANWSSFMAAMAGSFGTQLTPSSSIGFNFKVFHQKLADNTAGGEEGQGYSTDFGFDVGYLKKYKRSSLALKIKKGKKINRWFNKFIKIYDKQKKINEIIYDLQDSESNIYDIVENQEELMDEMEIQKDKLLSHNSMNTFLELDQRIISIISLMESLTDSLNTIINQDTLFSSNEKIKGNITATSEQILFEIMDIEVLKENILTEVEEMDIKDPDDKFNYGFCISNIGPKIDFVDAEQADPSPTNMRLGIFFQLYNDGHNKLNFLFDANKLLVTRYQMMDWDGDGYVGGFDTYGDPITNDDGNLDINDPQSIYNSKGKKEYDDKQYFDDPWYLAIFTAWLDDWLLGGDIDYDGDRIIGGWSLDPDNDDNSDGIPDNHDELMVDESGVYGKCINNEACIEKGTGENRTFQTELEEMIYNVGVEYWYTDAFALRAGYIYDFEGKIFNPTFGAGIRLLQYGFDFGYTAGEQGHPRANTMFFSINMGL